MTAVGQELRKAVTILLRLLRSLQPRHRGRFTGGCGDTENRTTCGSRKENVAIPIPGAAAHTGCVRQDLNRSAIDVNALQSVLGEKADRSAIRRPECVLRSLSTGQGTRRTRTERA